MKLPPAPPAAAPLSPAGGEDFSDFDAVPVAALDVKDTVTLVVNAAGHFVMADAGAGLRVYTYEGKLVSSPKFQGLRTELLNSQSVTLSPETLAVIDKADPKTIRIFDAASGKARGEPIVHALASRTRSADRQTAYCSSVTDAMPR